MCTKSSSQYSTTAPERHPVQRSQLGPSVPFLSAAHWSTLSQSSRAVRAHPIEGWTGALSMTSRWERRGAGYRLHVDAALDAPSDGEGSSFVALDVIVNEKPRGRERRRGQLVLSGGKGEFVYLRGDRHEQSRLIPFLLANA